MPRFVSILIQPKLVGSSIFNIFQSGKFWSATIYHFVGSSIKKVFCNLYIHHLNVNLNFFEESANSDSDVTNSKVFDK